MNKELLRSKIAELLESTREELAEELEFQHNEFVDSLVAELEQSKIQDQEEHSDDVVSLVYERLQNKNSIVALLCDIAESVVNESLSIYRKVERNG